MIVSPTAYGTCADIKAIVEICHDHDKPSIVDEAWGAHLPFCEELPTWAMDAGADICVVSVHKMGAGFEQGSVFHVQGDRIEFPHLSACADLLMTTVRGDRRLAATDGRARKRASALSASADGSAAVRHRPPPREMHVLEDKLLGAEASNELDRLQIMIDLSELGISGYQAADWLREYERIDMHLSNHARIVAMVSIADDDTTADRLRRALQRLIDAAHDLPRPKPIKIPHSLALELETVNRPRDAFFSPAFIRQDAFGSDRTVSRQAGAPDLAARATSLNGTP